MVDDRAQLYTIEGLIAGTIMLATAYFVLGTPVSFADSTSHISEMQLEQLGSDALLMMDTPDAEGEMSVLQEIVRNTDSERFKTIFSESLERSTDATVMVHDLSLSARLYYHVDGRVESYSLLPGAPPGREPSVCVSRWVGVNGQPDRILSAEPRPQVMLLEVLIWRG